MKRSPRSTKGFTLIELLVVIAILATLVALLLPAMQQSRESARRVQCRSNLKQLGLALHNYHELHRTFPPGVIARDDDLSHGLHSGLTFLLPMLERTNVYSKYNFDLPWSDPANVSVANVNIPVLRCPNAGGTVPQTAGIQAGGTDYAFSKGPNAVLCLRAQSEGMFDVNSLVRTSAVTDGLSNTFAMGEAASHASLRANAT
jgi:prepilin-type N-terminal cleavage/methylation domain-containing protein